MAGFTNNAPRANNQRSMARNGKKSRGYRVREQDSAVADPDPTPKSSSSGDDLEKTKKNARTRAGRRFSTGFEPEVDVFDQVWAIMEEREAARPVHIWGRAAENRDAKDSKAVKNAQKLARKYTRLPASEKKAYRKAMAALC
ncbi:hypothetical protein AC578_609 [Pseudocercospora eumusae]|uniref:Uncharacterized protein n=1 Tax=Pseudocercospora eumusae TaxID=321146 RepID=A0A139HFB1_9PEZI|nr:hypothetical protein AC578_609 [Pseudocercospora eumusae]